ncbi:MAG: hypothetical protein EBX98_05085 [Burkholderiaceae bacterium]|nr:hypothetical protein [Burkholderiaceae bacterium]
MSLGQICTREIGVLKIGTETAFAPFDFIDGGADDEHCLLRNRQAFERYRLLPRYLRDVSHRDLSVSLFGQTYASPLGISPTGLAGLFRPDADLMLAAAAREANVPFLLSSAANHNQPVRVPPPESVTKVETKATQLQTLAQQDRRAQPQ